MWFDLDISGEDNDPNYGEDDEPKRKVKERLLIGEDVEEGGEPAVELVEGHDGALLVLGDVAPEVVRLHAGIASHLPRRLGKMRSLSRGRSHRK